LVAVAVEVTPQQAAVVAVVAVVVATLLVGHMFQIP
jgi:hypothetical protein